MSRAAILLLAALMLGGCTRQKDITAAAKAIAAACRGQYAVTIRATNSLFGDEIVFSCNDVDPAKLEPSNGK